MYMIASLCFYNIRDAMASWKHVVQQFKTLSRVSMPVIHLFLPPPLEFYGETGEQNSWLTLTV